MADNSILYCAIGSQITTQAFGNPTPKGPHRGRDSVAKAGTPVYAAGTGVVTAIYRGHPVYGYRVEVRYPVIGGFKYVVGVGHLSRIDAALDVGDTVTPQTSLGLSGGKRGSVGAGISTAEHLHEDITKNGFLVDPEQYLANRTSAAGGEGVPIDMATPQELWAQPLNYASGAVDSAGVRLVKVYETSAAILAGQATILAAVRAISTGAPVDGSAVDTALAGIAAKLEEIDTEAEQNAAQILAALATDSTDEFLASIGLQRKP